MIHILEKQNRPQWICMDNSVNITIESFLVSLLELLQVTFSLSFSSHPAKALFHLTYQLNVNDIFLFYLLLLSYSMFKCLWNFRFLLKLTGSDEEINLLGDGTEKAEFGEWSWMSPEEVVERVSRPPLPFYLIQQL